MAKYLILWDVDMKQLPSDPKGKKKMLLGMVAAVKQQMKDGMLKEWGANLGEGDGYCTSDASEAEINNLIAFWTPLVDFKVRRLMSVDELGKAYKALPE